MYIYIYIYIFVCVYIYIDTYLYVYIHIYIYEHKFQYVTATIFAMFSMPRPGLNSAMHRLALTDSSGACGDSRGARWASGPSGHWSWGYVSYQVLVDGLVAINVFFPEILGCCHHPNWRTHIFQRGGPTTNQIDLRNGWSWNWSNVIYETCWFIKKYE